MSENKVVATSCEGVGVLTRYLFEFNNEVRVFAASDLVSISRES